MKLDALVKSPKKIFYGWWLLAAVTVLTVLNGGIWFYGFGTFFMPLSKEFSWSRGGLALALGLSRLEVGPEGLLVGWWCDRHGFRKIMILGIFIVGLGYMLFSRINSMLGFYLVMCGLITLGAGMGIGRVTYIAVANWFRRRAGLAFGIVETGFAIGGAVFVPLLGFIIASYGWRMGAIVAGILIWVVAFPLTALMRHRPEQYGYLPDGDVPTEVAETAAKEIEVEGFTWREAIKLPIFYWSVIVFATAYMVPGVFVIHQIPYLTDMGFSPTWAATALGSVAGVSITGRLGFGWLGDVWNRRYVMAICLVGMSIGMVILAHATTQWHIFLYIALFSPFYGGAMGLGPALRVEFFGRVSYGTIMGIQSIIQMGFTLFGPWFAGHLYDTTGSYWLAFIGLAGLCLISAVIIPLLKPRPFPVRGE